MTHMVVPLPSADTIIMEKKGCWRACARFGFFYLLVYGTIVTANVLVLTPLDVPSAKCGYSPIQKSA